MKEKLCIAVDFDSTLAEYEHSDNYQALVLGKPIPLMLERVKQWLKDGHDVVIFTARICEDAPMKKHMIGLAFQAWCQKYIGQVLEVTCMKSPRFDEIWDDRNVAVEPNTGKIMGRSRSVE